MKQFLSLLILFLGLPVFSQNSISGLVLDENKKPLPGASIYFDGTTFSTVSDDDGTFKLYYTTKSNSILAISYVGYETQYLKNTDNVFNLTIQLKEANNALQEVVVSRKDRFSRKEKLKIFRAYFLGTTSNAKKTTILNEDQLILNYNELTNTLVARCYEPLVIQNSALGYKLNYELADFEVNFWTLSIKPQDATRSYYAGLCRFTETENSDKIEKKRKNAFEGSQMQFFRNMANTIWGKNYFVILKNKLQDIPANNFTVTDEGEFKKVIVANQADKRYENNFRAKFILLYNMDKQSEILFDTEVFYIDKFGNNSHIDKITFSGNIAKSKVGDMLPLNYGME